MQRNRQVTREKNPLARWYLESAENALEQLNTTEKGLSSDEAESRLAEHGKNVLPSEPPPSVAKLFIQQFRSPLMYILLIAAVISTLLQEYTDAIFISLALALNAVVGTYQEWNAARSAAALQEMVPQQTVIYRDGHQEDINVEHVVPGDIVALEAGTRVPADARLLRANGLEIDESLLTGESVPVNKATDTLEDDSVPLGDRTNVAFASTIVTRGSGRAVVTDTALDTEIGKIATSISETETKTPLVQRMETFTRNIAVVIFGVAGLLAVLALVRGFETTEIFFMAVALAVSAIPEGLPIGMTVALSTGMRRMANRNVIVRKLVALEGLGSCTVISSDKTGTLTHNQMTVQKLAFPDGTIHEITGEGYVPEGELQSESGESFSDEQELDRINRLVKVGVLSNEAEFYEKDGEWEHHGDSVDVSLLVLGEKLGFSRDELLEREPEVGLIPFDSELRYAAAFHEQNGEVHAAVKGAYEALLSRCSTMIKGDETVDIDTELIEREALKLAEEGYRVLAFADGTTQRKDKYGDDDVQDLTFLGLTGMVDPLRQEAVESVAECNRAGVKVCMVTGDHPLTAFSIARDLGIADNEDEIITGSELQKRHEEESEEEFARTINSISVFARVEPFQKQQIVAAQTANGHFVAVTGDGVNDAPALNEAHIGVAMGTGTDVAKETADIVLTDDNFTSLVSGIEEGRIAYNNIRKIVYLLMSMAVAEVILFALSISLGYPLPLFAVQILWLNLATNGIQDIALAFEPGEGDEMKRKPRAPEEKIFDRQMIEQLAISGAFVGIVGFGAWVFLLDYVGMNEFAARNSLLLLLVFFENWHVLNTRSETKSIFSMPFFGNRPLIFAIIGAQALHVASMHLPFMQNVLSVEPVSLQQWLWSLALGASILAVMELYKFIRRRTPLEHAEPVFSG